MDFLKDLNKKQRRAVQINSSVVITAGPGTGKTKTLVVRIVYLISNKNIDPKHILALTFTKKAAHEMSTRLQEFGIKTTPYIATFHAFAYDVLQDVYGDIEVIEETKDKSRDKENQFTYDELIERAAKLLQEGNARISQRHKYFSHILVDELQDTNTPQYEIVKSLLSSKRGMLFAIGDPYQSIYGFRGADASIFEKVHKDIPSITEVVFTTNYRSTADIVAISQRLFPNIDRLTAHTKKCGIVQYIKTYDEKTETQWIMKDIAERMGGTDLIQASIVQKHNQSMRFADAAVIYRTHHIGRILQRWFAKESIPYQVLGGDSLFEQPYIRIIIEQIRTLSERDKNKKLSDIINMLVDMSSFEKEKKSDTKLRNLQQFKSITTRFDVQDHGTCAFLAYMDYLEEHEYYDKQADKVTLLTMHAAKGLEFDHVYIAGFENGIIPLTRGDIDANEEKRLLYVAMTRACKSLTLLRPNFRWGKPTEESCLYRLVKDTPLIYKVDPAIQTHEKRRKKWLDKKRQLKLF